MWGQTRVVTTDKAIAFLQELQIGTGRSRPELKLSLARIKSSNAARLPSGNVGSNSSCDNRQGNRLPPGASRCRGRSPRAAKRRRLVGRLWLQSRRSEPG